MAASNPSCSRSTISNSTPKTVHWSVSDSHSSSKGHLHCHSRVEESSERYPLRSRPFKPEMISLENIIPPRSRSRSRSVPRSIEKRFIANVANIPDLVVTNLTNKSPPLKPLPDGLPSSSHCKVKDISNVTPVNHVRPYLENCPSCHIDYHDPVSFACHDPCYTNSPEYSTLDVRKFKCGFCTSNFVSKDQLEEHLVKHLPERFVCRRCNFKVRHEEAMHTHVCGEEKHYDEENVAEAHASILKKQPAIPGSVAVQRKSKTEATTICKASESTKVSEMKYDHPNVTNRPAVVLYHTCNFCDAKFQDYSLFRMHKFTC